MPTTTRILVVDDDPDIRDVLARFLSGLGHRVETAADGEAGLEALLQEPPDVLLLDLELPRLSGLEVLRRIKMASAEGLDIVIITMSGHPVAERHLGPNSVALGASDFIMKPVDLKHLESTLRAHLQARDLD